MSIPRLNPEYYPKDGVKSALCTRQLGTGGSAYALRVGNMLIVSGAYSECTVSATYTTIYLCQVPLSELGISSITGLGTYVDVSGGGPSYQGSTNTGGGFDAGNGKVWMQTATAFSSRIVRFMAVAYVS